MLKGMLFLSLWVLGTQVPAYVAGDSGSAVKFKIKNLGVNITGSFTGLTARISFDPANLGASALEASVDANSINTGIDLRDDHLRKEEYFDVKNHPRIKFVSTKITAGGRGSYTVTGNLSIRGVTREISFPFTAVPQSGGFLFSGEFKINRRDFKVGGSSITLADNLTVILSVLAAKG